jgi:hypothetical protein
VLDELRSGDSESRFPLGWVKRFLRHPCALIAYPREEFGSPRVECESPIIPDKRKNYSTRLNALSSAQGERMMAKLEV